MQRKIYLQIVITAIIATISFLVYNFDLHQYLTLSMLKSRQDLLVEFTQNNFFISFMGYLFIYIAITALSIPGAAILTLGAGAIFGFTYGLILASFASTIGASLAFLASRFLLRDYIEVKYNNTVTKINQGIAQEGAFYLFALRLVPIFPFFIINLLMGITKMRLITFFIISQLGMSLGTIIYVYTGTQLAQIESASDVMSKELLLAFTLLGIFPLAAKKILEYLRGRRVMKQFRKPKNIDYNVVVIGGGSGGLVASYIASAIKAKVALVEKDKMGGDCLNTGCVPSKAFIKSAKIMHYTKTATKYGLNKLNAKFDFSNIMQRVQDIIKTIEPHDSVERYSSLGVECFGGTARIIDPFTVEVDNKRITTNNIIIATGARPVVPPIPGLEQIKYYVSDNIWELEELPKKMVILGGGPIGCEFAQSFARLGANVTQIEMANKIMGREDEDVSDFITNKFTHENINLLVSHKAIKFELIDNKQYIICEYQGKHKKVEFDTLLLALGRKANAENLCDENIMKINKTPQGTIAVDQYMRTNYPNIYACGDVVGPYQFTHVASYQAWHACVNSLFSPLKKFAIKYKVIPWVTFTDPEVARVGLNEQDARDANISYEVTKYSFEGLDRAVAESENEGFVKVLTHPGKDRILGATIVGPHAGELITEFTIAMKHNLGLNKILSTIYPYPTLAEANRFVAGNWKKQHAPEKILKFLAAFHKWRR